MDNDDMEKLFDIKLAVARQEMEVLRTELRYAKDEFIKISKRLDSIAANTRWLFACLVLPSIGIVLPLLQK